MMFLKVSKKHLVEKILLGLNKGVIMAKYTRHDARNKKKGRHKFLALNKDIKPHSVDDKREKYKLNYEQLYTRAS